MTTLNGKTVRVSKLPVYNMPSGVPFLRSLAKGLIETLGEDLPRALVFLPTRRAVRGLGNAFVSEAQESGSGVALLPRMRPLADIDPDEPPFEPGELVGIVSPAIPSAQRRFEMARIISHYQARTSELEVTPAGALAAADQLLAIMDDAAMEEVRLPGQQALEDIRAQAAAHYQNASKLYEIIQRHWPDYLAQAKLMEPMARRVALLNALTDHWTQSPPDFPVIIAGSTGTLKATARLMHCAARLPQSAIVLPGLDKNLRDSVWDTVGPQHPQNSLKRLIDTIGVDIEDIDDWPHSVPAPVMHARRRVLSEALVPAKSADDWPGRIAGLKEIESRDPFETAFDGLSIIEAANHDEEALCIAIILRDVLNEEAKNEPAKNAQAKPAQAPRTAALITPDPALARRVRAKLRRWQINVDYSQGEPLEETALGAYLSGLLRLALDPDNPVHFAFIAKHPLTRFGRPAGEIARAWSILERRHMRGPRKTLADLAAAVDQSDHKGRPRFNRAQKDAIDILEPLRRRLMDLADTALAGAKTWAASLCALAEDLASPGPSADAAPKDMTGAQRLWRGDAGAKASQVFTALLSYSDPLGEMDGQAFFDLFSGLLRGKVVRARYGTDPRLLILGPLEARMVDADLIILGGLNEGVWPAAPSVEPFLSRGMRETLGLSLPERRFGLQAHDFAELASHPRVILTRSERLDDGPAVASRWLWRLRTLAEGALGAEGAAAALSPDKPYLAWTRGLDFVAPEDVTIAPKPQPSPPLEARWPGPKGRTLAVTRLTTLTRDPYAHYAREILRLPVLDALDAPIGPREFGTAVHDALEDFAVHFKDDVPGDMADIIAQRLREILSSLGTPQEALAASAPRFDIISQKFTDWFKQTRAIGWKQAAIEETGRYVLNAPGGEFVLTAKSDRIDYFGASHVIVDYKTGLAPKDAIVQAGFDLQLPLQAAMILNGGFKGLIGDVEDIVYVSLRGHTQGIERSKLIKKDWTVERYAEHAVDTVQKLIAYFDEADAVYHSQPRIQFVNEYGDYDHLARRAEWSKAGGDPAKASE